VLAAGSSRRMGAGQNKVLLDLGGITVLEHSLALFASLDEVTEIILVISPAEQDLYTGELEARIRRLGVEKILPGGAQRFDSAALGVEACLSTSRMILIHDGARPFPPREAVRQAIREADETGGAILATPLHDTLKRAGETGRVAQTVPRENMVRTQTPQVFQAALLKPALEKARARGLSPTDESFVMERQGNAVAIVEGGPMNLKITTPGDLELARAILEVRGRQKETEK
jgi:2-C-methyl-D-erythritol 4-phosphate cytidylyltransferase